MENIKYHFLNIISVLLFSYCSAITINQFFKFSIAPAATAVPKSQKQFADEKKVESYENYEKLLEKGFFKRILESDEAGPNVSSGASSASSIDELTLFGTITGPWRIARALIKSKNEKEPEIFKIGKDVYGYKLVRIENQKVYLKVGEETKILDMFPKYVPPDDTKKDTASASANKIEKNVSRSEIKQNVLNKLDNALKGLRAGPYRVDGKIEGYKIFRIRPYNILYKYGARSGDIIKRVNGHAIDSTDKLYKMWETLKGESKITVDLDRGGKTVTFDFSISD